MEVVYDFTGSLSFSVSPYYVSFLGRSVHFTQGGRSASAHLHMYVPIKFGF